MPSRFELQKHTNKQTLRNNCPTSCLSHLSFHARQESIWKHFFVDCERQATKKSSKRKCDLEIRLFYIAWSVAIHTCPRTDGCKLVLDIVCLFENCISSRYSVCLFCLRTTQHVRHVRGSFRKLVTAHWNLSSVLYVSTDT